MKKIYLVKKDPLKNDQDNWIIMNKEQFLCFLDTPEGRKRKNGFGKIPGCAERDPGIVIECGVEAAKDMKIEQNHRNYLKRCREESGYSTITYSEMSTMQMPLAVENQIADHDGSFEDKVINKMMIDQLRAAIQKLPSDERSLMIAMLQREKRFSESAYGTEVGLSRDKVRTMKKKAYNTIRKVLGAEDKI